MNDSDVDVEDEQLLALDVVGELAKRWTVAIRFYITADQTSHGEHDVARYPKLVN